jgi:hypothetical protein
LNAAPARPALIHNPRSQRNRRNTLEAPADLPQARPESLDALRQALERWQAQGVDLLIISGGDGTAREVFTLLPQVWEGALPGVALLASGNANLIAADVGSAGHGDAGLQRLLEALRAGQLRESQRALLGVHWADGHRPPVYGMFAGAAALTRATGLAHEQVLAGGAKHGWSVALTLFGAIRETLRGGGWARGISLDLAIGTADPDPAPRFLFLVTTLERLLFGLWPFWGQASQPLRYLDIAAPPRRLLARLPRLLRGRPSQAMQDEGYRSGGAMQLALRPADDTLIVDGEAFHAGPQGFVIQPGPMLRFYAP